MWIKRQDGYCLKEIAGIQYLLPYGQKVADQKRGILLNDTGLFLWNELNAPMPDEELAEKLVQHYLATGEEAEEIRRDVKQFVQELLTLGILQECLNPICTDKTDDINCLYPTKEPLVGYLEIADMCIILYGSCELISHQFDAFFTEAQGERKTQTKEPQSNVNAHEKLQSKMQIEILQTLPPFHPNGKTLIRNEELVVSENEQGYIILFPSMNQIREAHMTVDGRFVQVYVKGWDKEKTQEELFHAIRHFFLFFAQWQGFFALHSASILYRGQAWLFSGHSGMGKSTHTNLWKEQFGTEIINGDLNLIGWTENRQNQSKQPIVYGMPWCGTSGIASTKSYPLGGIVLLGRADANRFESLSQDQKIVRVMQRMISPVWTEDMLEANLKCAAQLSKQIPIYYLLCTKEPSAAQVMKTRIDQEEKQR